MSLRLIGRDCACRGCNAPVNVWLDTVTGRPLLIDWGSMQTAHLCSDPNHREQIDLAPPPDAIQCRYCGATDVALSSWGRLVEFPQDDWLGFANLPMVLHCCQPARIIHRADALHAIHDRFGTIRGLAVPELDPDA